MSNTTTDFKYEGMEMEWKLFTQNLNRAAAYCMR